MLHVSYLFVPAGFLLSGLASLRPELVLPAAGLHAFGAGAIGAMALAVMMRASLGHTGHALVMSRVMKGVYVAALLAVLLRLCATFDWALFEPLILASGLAWALAFICFATAFAPKLFTRRKP